MFTPFTIISPKTDTGAAFAAPVSVQFTALYQNLSVQDPLTGLGAGFGSALADIFLTESLRMPAERLSDGGLTPATDTNLLYSPPAEAGVFPHLINNTICIILKMARCIPHRAILNVSVFSKTSLTSFPCPGLQPALPEQAL